jgi:hypothetical protein
MQIKVNDQEIMTLSETQMRVIQNDINVDEFDADMCRRLCYILEHKYEQCFKRLKTEWDQKLAENGVSMVPTDADAYAELVFAQPNYKDRKARDLESQE